jgi:ABC-type oligopeptide transport system substrate-binding subunit
LGNKTYWKGCLLIWQLGLRTAKLNYSQCILTKKLKSNKEDEMNRKLFVFLSLILVASMLLAACGQIAQPTVEAPVEATEVAPDEEPTEEAATEVVPTEEPTEPPVARTDRKGGWLDEVVFTVADPAAVVTQIKAGDIDIYAEGLSPAFATEVFESGLAYAQNQGTYYDILFNPAVMNDGSFNPFGNKKIREAFNWLIDRNYFVQEIFHGQKIRYIICSNFLS